MRRSVRAVDVIGGGLAGCEAAWQAASAGAEVTLYEMRPAKTTPAHHTDLLSELVCSNSLRSDSLENAAGLLKEEMRRLGSLILDCAGRARVPAGKALAVDRVLFAEGVTAAIESHPRITVVRREVTRLPAGRVVVVATGPLTSDHLSRELCRFFGEDSLSFFDAASPIVTGDSIDMGAAFHGSRYDAGDERSYLNCPLDEEQYLRLWRALVDAERAPRHDFEDAPYFEGCLPVEELARRGKKTLLFGPMKPVGLVDPRTGSRPYAVVQLRREDVAATLYNLVGFQTSLRWSEQRRVFRMIPALRRAEFVRYGVMHRNTFIRSPNLLRPTLQTKASDLVLVAGQLTGVEGYVESAATGLVAGINAARIAAGLNPLELPGDTMHGALCRYITSADPATFQPVNANFGLLPAPGARVSGRRARARARGERALASLSRFLASTG